MFIVCKKNDRQAISLVLTSCAVYCRHTDVIETRQYCERRINANNVHVTSMTSLPSDIFDVIYVCGALRNDKTERHQLANAIVERGRK